MKKTQKLIKLLLSVFVRHLQPLQTDRLFSAERKDEKLKKKKSRLKERRVNRFVWRLS